MQRKLYMEEYDESKHPFVTFDGHIYEDRVYDPEKDQEFYVMKEPEWLHIEPEKVYIFTYADMFEAYHNSDESIFVKLWKRIDDNTVIVGFWDVAENCWLSEDPEDTGLPAEDETTMRIEDYEYRPQQ